MKRKTAKLNRLHKESTVIAVRQPKQGNPCEIKRTMKIKSKEQPLSELRPQTEKRAIRNEVQSQAKNNTATAPMNCDLTISKVSTDHAVNLLITPSSATAGKKK